MPNEPASVPPALSTYKKMVWRSIIPLAGKAQEMTTWTVTGVAGIVALLVGNLDSASRIVSLGGIKWALILFSASLVFGVVSKMFGMALAHGIGMVQELEALLRTHRGRALMTDVAANHLTDCIPDQLAEAFLWPMSNFIRNACVSGLTDFLAADRRLVRMFCIQLYVNILHAVLALSALLTIALCVE